ncbi:MAG: hypothetical protein FH751_14260 [Firmicutes bacterium]|nr:hypothetical protein [Bacillota bacterium]
MYNDPSKVFTFNDQIYYDKIVRVYTESGNWYTYAESGRLDTDLDGVFKSYDGVDWNRYYNDYDKIKYEEGEHWSDNSYLFDMAYSQ